MTLLDTTRRVTRCRRTPRVTLRLGTWAGCLTRLATPRCCIVHGARVGLRLRHDRRGVEFIDVGGVWREVRTRSWGMACS